MIAYSIIQKSQLEAAKRLDAEYYQPEYLDLERKLNGLETKTIDEVSKSVVSFGAYSLTSYIEWQYSGVPYVNVGDIHDGYVDFSNVKYISEEVDEILKKSRVADGQILLTMAGTIGNAAVAHKFPKRVNANQAIAKITPLDEISPYYLAAFLNSKYGLLQTQREIVSSVQANIFLGPIKKFRVPVFDSKIISEIEDKYKSFLETLEDSKTLYFQAESLLLEELGLVNFEKDESLSWTISLSDVKTADRMDAEYFQPKYEKLLSKIKSHKSKLLPEIIENVPAKFDPSSKPGQSFKYVELSNINSSIGIIDGFSEVIGREAPSRAKRVLETNDVIISSVEGSLEKAALVHKEQEGQLASTGFFQFKSQGILPGVLLVLAKSSVFQMQLEKHCTGTILTAVPKEAVNKIIAPIVSSTTQQKIAELVRQSHEARNRSKQLLEEAKRKVEEAIEQEVSI